MSRKLQFKNHPNGRGFRRKDFDDLYGQHCSIQESSLGTEEAYWIGVHNTGPNISYDDNGNCNQESSRMHLSRKQVVNLINELVEFCGLDWKEDFGVN